jgi:nucleoside-diphosphate-sugar epimerase
MYRLAGTTWHADSIKAERELGIDHRPLEEGLREYLEWEMEQLGMNADAEQKAATA